MNVKELVDIEIKKLEARPWFAYVGPVIIEPERDAPDSSYEVTRRIINTRLGEKYGPYVGAGKDRLVYSTGRGYVVKIPSDIDSDRANVREYVNYKKYPEMRVAKCRMVNIRGVHLIIMEEVRIGDNMSSHPDYDRVSMVDCNQVGFNRRGQLVVYDAGSEMV